MRAVTIRKAEWVDVVMHGGWYLTLIKSILWPSILVTIQTFLLTLSLHRSQLSVVRVWYFSTIFAYVYPLIRALHPCCQLLLSLLAPNPRSWQTSTANKTWLEIVQLTTILVLFDQNCKIIYCSTSFLSIISNRNQRFDPMIEVILILESCWTSHRVEFNVTLQVFKLS